MSTANVFIPTPLGTAEPQNSAQWLSLKYNSLFLSVVPANLCMEHSLTVSFSVSELSYLPHC